MSHQRYTTVSEEVQSVFIGNDGTRWNWHDENIVPCECCPDCNTIISLQEQEIDNLQIEIKDLKKRLK